MSIYYNAVWFIDKLVIDMYFRKITVIGLENIPKEGPIIVCGNHSNQFIDAMIILSRSPRNLSFCMAASSYSKPVIGYCAKKIEVIPVSRPEDSKFPGKGKLKFLSKTIIEGINTSFLTQTKDFTLGIHSLLIGKNKIYVEEIISETQLKVKENKELYDLYQQDENYICDYFIIPKLDNSKLFNEAFKVLNKGKAICIFPEGTSHDRTDFLQLKPGVAIMALGAMAEHNSQNVKIIPAGLTYFKREQFRSEVVLEFGAPFEITKEMAELFKQDKKKAVSQTMSAIEQRMKAVTLTAPSYKEYNCISLVRDLYIPDNENLTSSEISVIGKRFSASYAKFKDLHEVKRLRKYLTKYHDALANVGIEDKEVKEFYYSYGFFVRKTIASFLLFHLYLFLTFPIIAITSPFLWFVRKKAEKERVKAKEKNPYKIRGLDVVSSVKITSFLKFLPVVFIMWFLFIYLILNVYLKKLIGVSFTFKTTFITSFSVFPFYALLCPDMIDSLFFYLETMKVRFLFFCYPKDVYKMKDERVRLTYLIREFVENHIEKSGYANCRIVKSFNENKNLKGRDLTCRIDKKAKIFKEEVEQFLEQNNLQ